LKKDQFFETQDNNWVKNKSLVHNNFQPIEGAIQYYAFRYKIYLMPYFIQGLK